MTSATVGNRPRQSAIRDHDRAARFQALIEERAIRFSQRQFFEPKITHPAHHETVLHWIMHVMKLQSGVPVEHLPRMLKSPVEFVHGFIWVDAGPSDGHEERLGEPGYAQGSPEMSGRAIGGPYGDRGISPLGVLTDHPF